MNIKMLQSFRLTRGTFFRILADMIMCNIALLLALLIRYLLVVVSATYQGDLDYSELFSKYLLTYSNTGWLFTCIAIVIFYLSGFYTYGRAYSGRYKVLVIVEAVSLSHLLFGFVSYFFRGALHLPRGSLALSWLFTAAFLVSARLWSHAWGEILRKEQSMITPLEERKIRNVLVIGGAGYIGSALLPKLLNKDYKVRLLDLFLYGTEPVQDVLMHPNLEIFEADFRQVDKVVEAMQSMDAVIHLGAIVGDPACALDEDLTVEVNVMATRMVAEVAKGSNVGRFIFASTCSVYGANDEILDERSTLHPVSLYARSKIASEKVLLSMITQNFAPTILRFSTIYGLSGRTRFDLVVNTLTAKAVVDGEITIYGGDQWRPFLHVDDAALAILEVLKAPVSTVRDQIFNVGSNQQNYTIHAVGDVILRLVPTAKLLNLGTDTDRRNYRVDFSKINNILCFTPRWTLEQGIQQVIDAIQSGQVKDYRNAKYSNVKFLNDETLSRLINHQNRWVYEMINGYAST